MSPVRSGAWWNYVFCFKDYVWPRHPVCLIGSYPPLIIHIHVVLPFTFFIIWIWGMKGDNALRRHNNVGNVNCKRFMAKIFITTLFSRPNGQFEFITGAPLFCRFLMKPFDQWLCQLNKTERKRTVQSYRLDLPCIKISRDTLLSWPSDLWLICQTMVRHCHLAKPDFLVK